MQDGNEYIEKNAMVLIRKDAIPKVNIIIEGKPIEQVSRMVYHGYMATEDGKSDTQIKRRIEITRSSCHRF